MRPTKDRGTDSNPILSKLMKLKYRINDAYKAGRDTEPVGASNKSDKDWVMEEIWWVVTIVRLNLKLN